MRNLINILNESSDYLAFVRASKQEGFEYFHFSCPIHRIAALDKFLSTLEKEHEVTYCDHPSPVDKDYLIAGPKRIIAPLERMLHTWAQKQGGVPLTPPEPKEPTTGLLGKLFH